LHKDIQTDFVQNEEDEGKTDRQGTQNTQTTQNTQNPTAVIAAGERAVRAYQHWQPHPHRPAWPHPCTQLLCAQRERGQREQQQSGSTGRRGQAQGPRQGQRQGSAAAARRRCGGGAGSAGAAASSAVEMESRVGERTRSVRPAHAVLHTRAQAAGSSGPRQSRHGARQRGQCQAERTRPRRP